MKLKLMIATVGLLLTCAASPQDMMTPVPAEMKALTFMDGAWAGDMTMALGPGEPLKSKCEIHYERILGGMYVKGMHKFQPEGMPEMTGMLMMTYDAKKKTWLSWWFDSTAPGIMEMKGSMKGNAWVFESEPTEMEGMGLTTTRATWTKVSDTRIKMKLEMKSDKDWMTFIEADYSKK